MDFKNMDIKKEVEKELSNELKNLGLDNSATLEEQVKYIDSKVLEYIKQIESIKSSFNGVINEVNVNISQSKENGKKVANDLINIDKKLESITKFINNIKDRSNKVSDTSERIENIFNLVQNAKDDIEKSTKDFNINLSSKIDEVSKFARNLQDETIQRANDFERTQNLKMSRVKKSNILIFGTLAASAIIGGLFLNNLTNNLQEVSVKAKSDIELSKVLINESTSKINIIKNDVKNLDYAKEQKVKEGFNVAQMQIQNLKNEIENLKKEIGEKRVTKVTQGVTLVTQEKKRGKKEGKKANNLNTSIKIIKDGCFNLEQCTKLAISKNERYFIFNKKIYGASEYLGEYKSRLMREL